MADINVPIINIEEIQLENVPIGRGGYGTVFLGKHPTFGHVAVKTLIDSGHLPQKHVDVLRQEAKKLLELCQHDGILHLHGLVMQQNNYSLILEYMPLGSVRDFRNQFTPQFPLYVRFMMEVSSAMNFLHTSNPVILHLDLKADNILLDGEMHAKVSDFGLSEWKTVTVTATRRTDSVDRNERRCTVSHVPPEVWSNINTPTDRFYDIYGFGLCIWEMLTGKVPYGNAQDDLIRSAVLSGQRPDCSLLPNGCPPILTKVMMQCWHQRPSQRPAFSVLKRDLEKAFDNEFKRDIITSMKNIRQEIKNSYPSTDLAYIYTNHIDHISDNTPPPSTNIPTQTHTSSPASSTSQPEPPPTSRQPVVEDVEPPIQKVLHKKEEDLSSSEANLRRILRDPLALRVARSQYSRDFFILDSKCRAILNDDKKLKRYLEEDETFKNEILYPGNDFWGNVGGSHLAMARERAKVWLQANKDELDSLSRSGRYPKSSYYTSTREEETDRSLRRKRVEKTYYEHPHIKELKKSGSYFRVKKALENPDMFETLLKNNEPGTSNPLSLTTLDPEVIKLAKDPIILLALLHSEWSLLRDLMSKPQSTALLMKVIGNAKQKYPLPGGGYITKPSRSRYPGFHDRDLMMFDMFGPEMMMREMEMRRHMDSDEEEDYMMSMGMRGMHRKMKDMMRHSKKDSMAMSMMSEKMEKMKNKDKKEAMKKEEMFKHKEISKKRIYPAESDSNCNKSSSTESSSSVQASTSSAASKPAKNSEQTKPSTTMSDPKIPKISSANSSGGSSVDGQKLNKHEKSEKDPDETSVKKAPSRFKLFMKKVVGSSSKHDDDLDSDTTPSMDQS